MAMLLAKGADVGVKNSYELRRSITHSISYIHDGDTPLHFAVTGNHEGIASMLISNNADLNARNKARRRLFWPQWRVAEGAIFLPQLIRGAATSSGRQDPY